MLLPLVNYMKYLVQRDYAVGLDETSCRLLFPKNAPSLSEGDLKSRRLADKIAEAKAKGERSLLAKRWVYRGLVQAPYNIFDSRVSRHREYRVEERRDKAERKQLDAARRRLAAQAAS